MPKKEAATKTFTFGACKIAKVSPQPADPATLNIYVSFDEALKLHVAMLEAVRTLNSYNRAKKEGKSSAVNVTVDFQKQRIRINRGTLRPGS